MKKKAIVFALGLSFILSACSSGNEQKLTAVNSGKKIEDIHGVGIEKDGSTYVATHEGLFTTQNSGKNWSKVGSMDADLMGFTMKSDGTMLTSGHPGTNSNLPNPIGVLDSKDKGLNWNKIEYTGKIDFHVLTSDFKDPNVIYGLNQMGTGQYGAGIYKTLDGGKNWLKIEPKGLPGDLMKVYSLLVLPENKNYLLAGTEIGVLLSKDGGKQWEEFDNTRLITAMTVMPNGKDLLAYSMSNQLSGVMVSNDEGQSWSQLGLDLGKDAASSLSINPQNEKELVLSTFSTSLYHSTDGGQNWDKLINNGKFQ